MTDQFAAQPFLPGDNLNIELPLQLLLVGAMRQSLWIHTGNPPTYEEALHFTVSVAAKIVPLDGELAKSYDSATARRYRQRAKARSKKTQKEVTPLELIKYPLHNRWSDG